MLLKVIGSGNPGTTRIVDSRTGEPIEGVKRIVVDIEPDKAPVVYLRLDYVKVELDEQFVAALDPAFPHTFKTNMGAAEVPTVTQKPPTKTPKAKKPTTPKVK